ncbi:MAG: hypothetical protein PHW00_05475, partial [Clostridia bacterium]|nr:hypothetical protein [Clostridia bacterium]
PVVCALLDVMPYDDIIDVILNGNDDTMVNDILNNVLAGETISNLLGSELTNTVAGLPVVCALLDVMPYDDIIDVILNGNDDTMVNDILNNVLAGETISNLLGSELTNTVAGLPVIGALLDVMPYDDIIAVILDNGNTDKIDNILSNVLAGETISNLLGSELTNTVAGLPVICALLDVMPYDDILSVIFNDFDNNKLNTILNNVLGGETILTLLGPSYATKALDIIVVKNLLDIMIYDDILAVLFNNNIDNKLSTILDNMLGDKTLANLLAPDLDVYDLPFFSNYADVPVLQLPTKVLILGAVGAIAYVVVYTVLGAKTIGELMGYYYDPISDLYYTDTSKGTVAPSYLEWISHICLQHAVDTYIIDTPKIDLDGLINYIFDDVTLGDIISDFVDASNTPILHLIADVQPDDIITYILNNQITEMIEYLVADITIADILYKLFDNYINTPFLQSMGHIEPYTCVKHILDGHLGALAQHVFQVNDTQPSGLQGSAYVIDTFLAQYIPDSIESKYPYVFFEQAFKDNDILGAVVYVLGDLTIGEILDIVNVDYSTIPFVQAMGHIEPVTCVKHILDGHLGALAQHVFQVNDTQPSGLQGSAYVIGTFLAQYIPDSIESKYPYVFFEQAFKDNDILGAVVYVLGDLTIGEILDIVNV